MSGAAPLTHAAICPAARCSARSPLHGLFEGGRWCDSEYGHAQIGVTAAACGDRSVRIVQK
jgi:hypothetical protein